MQKNIAKWKWYNCDLYMQWKKLQYNELNPNLIPLSEWMLQYGLILCYDLKMNKLVLCACRSVC